MYVLYVCMYVCMYVCIYICIYIYYPLRSTFDALLETYMVKLSAHFKKGCSKFTRYGQTHCTLQLSVQWVHQTWSNSMHTSIKCAVCLITWNFVSRCGSTFGALQETYMVKLIHVSTVSCRHSLAVPFSFRSSPLFALWIFHS